MNRTGRSATWWNPLPLIVCLAAAAGTLSPLAAAPVGSALPQGTGSTANAERGKAQYAKTCVACHGERAEGKRELSTPALHTQEPWYLLGQLQKFRSGLRGYDPKDVSGSLMKPIAMGLPDEQALADLAAFVSSIDGPPAVNEVKGDVSLGAATYRKVCATCHGVDAKGKPELKTPALVGQNDWYLLMQLQKFKQGLRGANPKDVTGAQMRAIANTFSTDQAMKDVAAYIATLK